MKKNNIKKYGVTFALALIMVVSVACGNQLKDMKSQETKPTEKMMNEEMKDGGMKDDKMQDGAMKDGEMKPESDMYRQSN